MTCGDYILNNEFVSSTLDKTEFCAFGNLISIDKPIYRIPLHVCLAIYVAGWRDSEDSTVPMVARQIACGIVLGGLAIVGLIDTIVRVGSAILMLAIKRSIDSSKPFLLDSSFGLSQSFYFVTSLQLSNLFEENLMRHIIRK